MTREEAIEWLDDIKNITENWSQEVAIDMAIEALSEPKTGRDCTDFVRWLMDEVMDEENWRLNAVADGEIICRKLKKLGMLDVVDGYYVETQETGEWKTDTVYAGIGFYRCDQCDFRQSEKSRYCPNCGAEMRGE